MAELSIIFSLFPKDVWLGWRYNAWQEATMMSTVLSTTHGGKRDDEEDYGDGRLSTETNNGRDMSSSGECGSPLGISSPFGLLTSGRLRLKVLAYRREGGKDPLFAWRGERAFMHGRSRMTGRE